MNSEDLMKELDRLRGELQNLEQGRQYLLRRTGIRISSTGISLEATINGIKEALQKIRGILQERGFGARLLAPEIKKP
jgi:hypothetical protein